MSRAAEYRKKRKEKVEQDKSKGTEVEVPSGSLFVLKKVNMLPYTLAANLPRTHFDETLEAWAQQSILDGIESSKVDELKAKQQAAEDNKQNMLVMGRIVQEACISPRIVVGGTGDDELDPSELEEPDIWFIYRWAIGLRPGSTIPTGAGEVPVGSVAAFPKKAGRRIRASSDVQQVRQTA